MHCLRCGNTVPAGARHCVKCGAQVSDPAAPTIAVTTDQTLEATDSGELMEHVRQQLAADYEVLGEVGRGGMAVVYRARELDLGRIVALKVLPPDVAIGPSMADRFRREARMAAALDHPNIIPIYRVGTAGKLIFIAMKFVEGRALDGILERQGPLPVPVALQVLRGAAGALAYAHEHGIIHRDIKSANILIPRDGRPLVSDFGVARGMAEKSLTATGAVIGTPYFMSPEQCAGKHLGPQTDQYSLGIVAFQMLTGAVPFDADSLPGIMQHHWFSRVPDLAELRDDLPPALVSVINRALAKDPSQRYEATSEMVHALDAVPIPEKDRLWGDAMLRQLAIGTTIPAVEIGPLRRSTGEHEDTVKMSHGSLRAITAVRARRLAPRVAAGAALAAVAVMAWWRLAPRANGAADPVVTPAATAAAGALGASDSAPVPVDTPAPRRPAMDKPPAQAARRADGTEPAARKAVAAAEPPPPRIESVVPGRIRLRIDPPDATIAIDGRTVGHGVLFDLPVGAGVHRLNVSAAGYAPLDTTIRVDAGQTLQLGRRMLTAQAP